MHQTITRRAQFIAVASAGLLCLSACTAASGGDAGEGQSGGSGESVHIAIAQLLPYAATDKNGDPEGYSIDVVKQVMGELGVTDIQTTVTTFDAMIPGLQAKQFDLLPGGLTYTPERCEVIGYSAPITVNNDALYVPEGNPKELSSVAELVDRDEVKLIALQGSSQEKYLLDQGIDRGRVAAVSDAQAAVDALTNGRGDAILLGQFSIGDAEERGLEVMPDLDTPLMGIGVGMRKEDSQLREDFDRVLNEMRESGELGDLYEKWGFTNREILESVSTPSDVVPSC
ncbi:transporter substrate-binding domain-containing protein [Leucobacter sp. CSA1]|uniref:Transporter substrate-binding domain-containing protein n=1 Tax=Leucobacter chromiisoli TaxID=2796471 RepID=A0A934Q619_9MICO|nr:transporter substrate-binding domain-containing protein [Leucobacter chromiisoli]MBK0418301.1 transporter substrate-binding domain-containing protein [Leucobacter chromiisoli]